jgi:hypothetical protein
MKKIFITICTGFGLCNATFATTVNYNWLVDGTNYAQTTCETGDDLILPTPSPTKYGYHFVGWVESEIFGSWSQSGTPTPQNPIEPVFKPFLNTVLRAVGSGDNFVADSYDPETRTITRRIGVKVLDGTENITIYSGNVMNVPLTGYWHDNSAYGYCTHYEGVVSRVTAANMSVGQFKMAATSTVNALYLKTPYTSANDFKSWLADQYNAGTPVTVYYPLATPTEERIQ